MNRDGSNMTWVENGYDGLDYWPAWSPDGTGIYFVSDRDGCENVYTKSLRGGDAAQITHYTGRAVQYLSISNSGRVLFVQDFRLRTFDLADMSNALLQPRIVPLNCATESKHTNILRLDIAGSISEMALSPLGNYLAVIARGELFLAPIHDPKAPVPVGDARYWESVRITNNSFREQYVSWNPKGDKVVLVSDRDGNNEVYEINLRTQEQVRLTNSPEDEYVPKYSPTERGSRIIEATTGWWFETLPTTPSILSPAISSISFHR